MKKKKIRKQITSMLLAFAMFISLFGGYSIKAEAATPIILQGNTYTTSPGEGFTFDAYFYCGTCKKNIYEDSNIDGHSFEITSFTYTISGGTFSWNASAKFKGCGGEGTIENNYSNSYVCDEETYKYLTVTCKVLNTRVGSFLINITREKSAHRGNATCRTADNCALCNKSYTNSSNHEKPDEFIYSVSASDNTKHDKKYSCCGTKVDTLSHTKEPIYTVNTEDNTKHDKKYGCCEGIAETTVHSNYTYSKTAENIITAKCNDCDYEGSLMLSAPNSPKYDGKEQEVRLDGAIANITVPEITYTKDGVPIEGKPVDVGTYTASITIDTLIASVTYEIVEGDMDVTATGCTGSYDGAGYSIDVSAPDGAKVEYKYNSDEWFETNPTFSKVGTYTVEYKVTKENYNDVTGSATVTINPADMTVAAVVMSPESGTYTGTVYEPEISVVYNGVTLTEGTDYECSWDKAGLTNANSYTVTVTGKGNFEGTTTKTFSITQKEIAIEWSGTQFMPYTGQLVLPEALAIGLADGDTCEVVVSLVETAEGAGINPGQWTAKITGLSNGNYKLPENSDVPLEVSYTIYANQTAPVVSGVDETINGKEDGHISGLTTEMEYAAESSDYSGGYTRITDPNMSFAPGTYYVRYAAKAYYYASPYTEVIISAGDKLNVNVPETQKGYTLTADEEEVSWNGTSTLTFVLSDGYSKIDSFAVKVNNETVTLDADGKYVISNIQQNQAITVEGVADITAPAAEIQLKENKWNQFLNHITFALFFNKTQDVTIIADDMGSGLDTIYYYLSDRELELDEVGAVNDWQEYNGTFQINPENKYVIYAKAVDKDGNITYINSDGVVLDSIVPVISGIENDTTYYTTQKVTVTDDNLKTVTVNGNEVTGEIVLEGDEDATYTIVATDKAGNSTTVTVTMKPIKALAEATEHLSHDNVTSDDAPALEELIEKLDELIADPDTSENGEKETLQQHKSIAEGLLKTIDEAAKATDTENTEKVQDVTSENVTTEDKTDLEKAKDDLEKALEDNDGNYTEDEKKAIEDEIERIDDALEVIENVEEVESLINKIPENITKKDEATIKAAEKAYNALSDYEKSLVDKNVKKALDDAKADLEKVKKPAEKAESTESTSPDTGDNSNLWMWFVFLFISGGTLVGINVHRRKIK